MSPATLASKTSSFLSTSSRMRSVRRSLPPLILATSSVVSVFQVPGSPQAISKKPGLICDFINLVKGSRMGSPPQSLDIRFRQRKVAAGVGDDFVLLPGGNKRVVVQEAVHLAPHVGAVALIEIEK